MYHRWRKGGDHTENTRSSLEPTDIVHQSMHTSSDTTRCNPHLAGDAHSAVWMEQTCTEMNISRAPKGQVLHDAYFKYRGNDGIRQNKNLFDGLRRMKRGIDLRSSICCATMQYRATSSKSIASTRTAVPHWIFSQNARKLRKKSLNFTIWRIASPNCRHIHPWYRINAKRKIVEKHKNR